MKVTEKEIEDYLIETKMGYFDLELNEKQNSLKILRQFSLDPYGIVDILTFGNYNSPTADENIIDINIFEIKNEPIHLKQLSQLYRYADGIRGYTENFKLKENQYINITPHLIVPFFDETVNNLIYLVKALSDDVGMRKYDKTVTIRLQELEITGFTISLSKGIELKHIFSYGFQPSGCEFSKKITNQIKGLSFGKPKRKLDKTAQNNKEI